ncbi:MAG: U32 family peptidase [Oscillospiraceae bacterium]
MEILAPVGGPGQLTAAVRCGADAVYLGAGMFNARQSAQKFDGAALRDAVSFCRGRGVSVHVTLNTIVFDDEFEELERELRAIAEAGTDAVIVQDLAVARFVRECCPTLPMHASTQMSIHELQGALEAKSLGFSRVVLARELSLPEIREIARNSGIEIEVFIHGALCMCLSGGCYLSAMLGGMSGNRGRCKQPCRLDFRDGARGYALSLKDMSHVEYIDELRAAGVASLKIEGRMKRPEYVAAAVTAVRAALEGKKPDMETLRAVFSRGGFTDGYIKGRRTLDMFGRRTREDEAASVSVLGSLAGLYRREGQFVPVDMVLSGYNLTVTDGKNSVTEEVRAGAADKPEQGPPGGEIGSGFDAAELTEKARKNLGRTGNTPFYLRGLTVEGGFLPSPSQLNALRQAALGRLLEIRSEIAPHEFRENCSRLKTESREFAPEKPEFRFRFEKASQIPPGLPRSTIILPLAECAEHPEVMHKHRVIGEFPAFLSGQIEIPEGVSEIITGNLGGIRIARERGLVIHGGHALNIVNSVSLGEYGRLGLTDVTLSFEMSMRRIRALGQNIKRGIIAYGRLPLMTMRACPHGKCGGCGGRFSLTDRRGAVFPLICSGKKYVTLLNSVPLHIADKKIPPLDFLTLYFTIESAGECAQIIRDYEEKRPYLGERTGGLYFRELV